MDNDFRENIMKKSNLPKTWVDVAPIVQWKDEDVWLFILMNNIKVNNQYYMGYNRCGCLICPYQTDYIDILTSYYYPKAWNRWISILKKSYELYHDKYQWTLDEYLNGAWKTGVTKVYDITTKKPTAERVHEVMNILGVDDEEVARKYFVKKCSKCSKNLNPTEIAMNLKLFGRGMDVERRGLCKKCMCEQLNITTKKFSEMAAQFRNDGCNLF